jgi:peptidoglycan/xylan/chitin deacetylase (PgdA/CDA1 family)
MGEMRDSYSEERAPAGDSILILAFHALEESGDVLSYPPSLLGEAVERLLGAGWEAVTVRGGADRLRAGSQPGRRLLAISFDDGYRSIWDHGFPVLERLGVPATVFINGLPGASGALPPMEGRDRMTAGQIREWAAAGGEVGAHSVTHPDLTSLTGAALDEEMAESKTGLEEITGKAVTSFAYPFGFHDPRVRAAARRHFHCACGTEQGIAGPGSDLYALARIEMADFRDRVRLRLLSGPWLGAWLSLLAGPRWLSQRRLRRRVHAQAVARG